MSDLTCSVCQKAVPLPALICTMCTDTPTYYCDTKCRDRRQTREIVYRTGALLQGIFYAFREAAFDLKIKRIEKVGGVLHAYEEFYNLSDRNDGPLYRFPGHLLVGDRDKAKLLTYAACNDAFVHTLELAEKLLSDISAIIEEVNFNNLDKNPAILKIDALGGSQGLPSTHSVMVVGTKPHLGGDAYVFDLGGAQYSQPDAVVPFDKFARKQGEVLTQIYPHGHFADFNKRVREGTQGLTKANDFRVYHVQHQIKQCMLVAVKVWEAENKTDIQKLVRGNSKAFGDGKGALIAKIRGATRKYVEKWEQNGRRLKPYTELHVGFEQIMMGVAECTIKVQGGGSQAYRRYLADKSKRGVVPDAGKGFIDFREPKAEAESGAGLDTSWSVYLDQLVESFKASGNVSILDTRSGPK